MRKLVKLLELTNETKEVAKEAIPLIVKIPINRIHFEENRNLQSLLNRLSALIEGIVFSDEISLNELVQNNYEFLDTMRTVLFKLSSTSKRQKSHIVDEERIRFLRVKIDKLIAKLDAPPFLQRSVRRKFTKDKDRRGLDRTSLTSKATFFVRLTYSSPVKIEDTYSENCFI